MKTLTIQLPDGLDLDVLDAKMMLASKLYEKGKLSLGQAAEFSGLSKLAFMELLGNYDVSVINYPLSDLDKDISNAKANIM